AGNGYFGKLVDFLLQPAADGINVNVGFIEDRRSEAALLLQQGEDEVLDVNLLIPVPDGDGLGTADGVLHLLGESVNVHTDLSVSLSTILSLYPTTLMRKSH